MCSYQHTGFVLIETTADTVVMKDHRGGEIFRGHFNAFRVGGGGYFYYIYTYIYIYISYSQDHLPQN